MDSIGDYIYFIMIAIAVISGVLKNKKKKFEQELEPDFDEEWAEDNSSEIDPELKLDPEINTVLAEERQSNLDKGNYHTAFTSLESVSNFDTLKESTSLRTKKDVRTHKPSNSELKTDVEPSAPSVSFSTPEDIRAAFIASEIFHRKY